MRRKKTARFEEIARHAGVSVATVDRVLNERDSVAAVTREKVIEAARTLGIPRRLPDTRHGLVHLDVVLPDNPSPFFRRLDVALQRSATLLGRHWVVHQRRPPERDEAALIEALGPRRYRRQALIVAAPDTPAVREALRAAQRRGEQIAMVVTRVNEVPGAAYIGIDNHAAGRTAGYLLGRMSRRTGRVLVLSSRRDYLGHRERRDGCVAVLGEHFAQLSCELDLSDTHDDADACYHNVSRALARPGALAGLYNTGAGSPGIEAALRRHGAGEVCWVTHELSDDHRRYLQQGLLDVVIDQDPDTQAIRALQHVHAAVENADLRHAVAAAGEFRLYVAENMGERGYLEGAARGA